jgi:protein tyrosine phosphatase (PTP) superfamily phosphohydrolase (DUF442 family)
MPVQLFVSPCSLPVANNVCFNIDNGAYFVTAQPIYNNPTNLNPYVVIAQAGINSVLCVRDPQEIITQPNPFDLTESQELILNGVTYTNVSLPHVLPPQQMTQQQFDAQAYSAATVINGWRKPVLTHCSSGDRASAAFAVFMISYLGWTNANAASFAQTSLALANPQFVQWVTSFQVP